MKYLTFAVATLLSFDLFSVEGQLLRGLVTKVDPLNNNDEHRKLDGHGSGYSMDAGWSGDHNGYYK